MTLFHSTVLTPGHACNHMTFAETPEQAANEAARRWLKAGSTCTVEVRAAGSRKAPKVIAVTVGA